MPVLPFVVSPPSLPTTDPPLSSTDCPCLKPMPASLTSTCSLSELASVLKLEKVFSENVREFAVKYPHAAVEFLDVANALLRRMHADAEAAKARAAGSAPDAVPEKRPMVKAALPVFLPQQQKQRHRS